MTTQLTVIICTHNRYAVLGEAIASIEIQDFPADRLELVVVDNSTDISGQRQFTDNLDIACSHKYIIEPVPGLSRARNIGVAAAQGEIVAFMDDDALAGTNWVSRLAKDFADHPEAGVVGGPVAPIWPNSRPSWLHPWLEGYLTIVDRGPEMRALKPDEWLAGTNIAYRRDLLIKAGNFSESLGRVGKLLLSNEELLVTEKIRELGYSVLYDPAAAMRHRVHEDRINQAWMRRRVFWQVVSDLFVTGGEKPVDFNHELSRVLQYQAQLPPRHRGLPGLFVDSDDPETFHQQVEALGAFIRLVAMDGRDWRAFLEGPGTKGQGK